MFFTHITIFAYSIGGGIVSLVVAVTGEELAPWAGVAGFSGLALWATAKAIQDYRGREMEQEASERAVERLERSLRDQQALTAYEQSWARRLANELIRRGIEVPEPPPLPNMGDDE